MASLDRSIAPSRDSSAARLWGGMRLDTAGRRTDDRGGGMSSYCSTALMEEGSVSRFRWGSEDAQPLLFCVLSCGSAVDPDYRTHVRSARGRSPLARPVR